MGSERFAWLQYPGAERVCRRCRKELRVRDVGENRTRYGPKGHGTTDFLCVECQREVIAASIDETRKRMGLAER